MSAYDIQSELSRLQQRIESLETSGPRGQAASGCSACGGGPVSGPATIINDQGIEASPGAGPTLRARSSIDSTRTDNGFLGCVYARYRETSNNTVLSHSTSSQAFSNLRAGGADFSIIVGHGAPGVIITGSGQVITTPDKYMRLANESSWRTYATAGVPGTRLVLFGCEVASGTAGNNFIRRVANIVRKEVGAWTGLVWCSSTTVWGTGEFIVVRPGAPFSGIVEAPVMFEPGNLAAITLMNGDEREEVSLRSVVGVNYTPVGALSGSVPAQQLDANRVLNQIDFANPFVTEDKPAAILVGLLTITYQGDDRQPRVRAFRVLAYSLLEDCSSPNTYYYAAPTLRRTLGELD